MTVEQFGLQEFIDALKPYATEGPKFVQGEFVWYVSATHGNKVVVRSSIGLDGKSAGAGEDSIRCWLTGDDGMPLAHKLQKYVTRVNGWQTRLQDKVDRLIELSSKLGVCPKCRAPLKIIKSNTPKNPGRLFKKCSRGCKDWIGWFDELEREPDDVDAPLPATKPTAVAPAPQAIQDLLVDKAPKVTPIVPKPRTVQIRGGSVPPADVGITYANFVPSTYQQAVFDTVSQADHSIVIQALAGTGKTKTLAQLHAGSLGAYAMRRDIKNLAVLSMAFNVKIADALKLVMPPNVTTGTIHRQCWAAVRRTYNVPPGQKPNSKKTWDHFNRLSQIRFEAEVSDNGASIVRLISLLRTHVMEPIPMNLDFLVNRFNIVLDGDKDVIYDFTANLFHSVVNDYSSFDFDDMLYLVAIGAAKPDQFDVVTDDEAQDANPAQRLSILKMVRPEGRVIVVGDRNQSIYGFSGADPSSMDKFVEALDAIELPLSICYRCPTSVLDAVRSKFPDVPIENSPWAKEGAVLNLPYRKLVETATPGSLVLCRTNAPNAKLFLEFTRAGKKAAIIGRDFGATLIAKIKKIDKKYNCGGDIEIFLSALQTYTDAEVGKLMAAKRETAAGLVSDEAETILVLSDGSDTVQALVERTESIFTDKETEGVNISTVHKMKGGEANNVYIIHPELMPHPMAKTEEDCKQERNIEYVAWTRSKETLTFVEGK